MSKKNLMPFSLTPEYADAVAAGRANYYIAGVKSKKLSASAMLEYESSKLRHYVVGGPKRSAPVENAYFLWCKCNQIPYVRVTKYRKYADVVVDVICLPTDRHFGTEARAEFMATIYRECVPPCFVACGPDRVWLSHVRLDHAEEVAALCWAIATAPRLPFESDEYDELS